MTNRKKGTISTTEVERILDLLYFKENWTIPSLRKHVIYSTRFTYEYIQQNYGEGVIASRDGEHIAINARLYTKFGSSLILYAKRHPSGDFSDIRVLDSLDRLASLNFNAEETPLLDVDIGRVIKDLSFPNNEEDFDLSSIRGLEHVISQRAYRVPAEMEKFDVPTRILMIQNSVKIALANSKIDPLYVRPMYSFETKEIQFLVPLVLSGQCTESVLVLRKIASGKWVVVTILLLESALFNARVIAPLTRLWVEGGHDVSLQNFKC